MKSTSLAAGALAIALVSGTGGYFLGKGHSRTGSAQVATPSTKEPTRAPAVATRPELPTLNTKEFKAKLDAETNSLKRFNLALENLEAWIAKNPKEALDWLATQE
ncbi:MAG: hypothetical protein EOP85_11675, partial [Verrucomicrobiaceae bacterium]